MSEKKKQKITHVQCSLCEAYVSEAHAVVTPNGLRFICKRCKRREQEAGSKFVRKQRK